MGEFNISSISSLHLLPVLSCVNLALYNQSAGVCVGASVYVCVRARTCVCVCVCARMLRIVYGQDFALYKYFYYDDDDD